MQMWEFKSINSRCESLKGEMSRRQSKEEKKHVHSQLQKSRKSGRRRAHKFVSEHRIPGEGKTFEWRRHYSLFGAGSITLAETILSSR